jgi:hypothetical protein
MKRLIGLWQVLGEAEMSTKCLLKILHRKESGAAFHFWFRKIVKAETTRLAVGFFHPPALTQTTLSSVKGCHSLCWINGFCDLWNGTALQLCDVVYASKRCIE